MRGAKIESVRQRTNVFFFRSITVFFSDIARDSVSAFRFAFLRPREVALFLVSSCSLSRSLLLSSASSLALLSSASSLALLSSAASLALLSFALSCSPPPPLSFPLFLSHTNTNSISALPLILPLTPPTKNNQSPGPRPHAPSVALVHDRQQDVSAAAPLVAARQQKHHSLCAGSRVRSCDEFVQPGQ